MITAPQADAQRERLLECVGPDRADNLDPDDQVDLVLALLARAAQLREAAA